VRLEPLVVGERCPWSELPRRARPGAFGIFGVPLDLGSAVESGAREGPRWIRQAMKESYFGESPGAVLDLELRREYDLSQLSVLDLGNIDYVPGEPLELVGRRIDKLTGALVGRGMVPIMLGGDHSLTYYTLRALFRRNEPIGVLHFDAHPDLYVGPSSALNVLNHANPFYFACQSPQLALLRQLGLRTLERVSPRTRRHKDPRVSYVSALELERGAPADAFAGLPRDLPYYLSFDVDCLDPGVAPETGSTVVGGLSYYRALELVDYASRHFRIIGADFVEVSRRIGPVHLACQAVARYLTTLMLNSQPFGAIDGYQFESMR
jgi:agmatinase